MMEMKLKLIGCGIAMLNVEVFVKNDVYEWDTFYDTHDTVDDGVIDIMDGSVVVMHYCNCAKYNMLKDVVVVTLIFGQFWFYQSFVQMLFTLFFRMWD
jgi:hypothetical protein